MAHTFLKAQKIASTAMALLQREIVLPGLVRTWNPNDFKYAQNDTVNIPVRAKLVARDFALRATGSARQIVADDLTESSIPITLSKVAYSAVFVTDEQLTLDIASFTDQVLNVQVRSLAEKCEAYIYNQIKDESNYLDGVNLLNWQARNGTPVGAYATFVKARQVLNVANVPAGGRIAIVGPNAEALILTDPALIPSQLSGGFGTTGSALSEASLGRLAGFDIFTSNIIGDNEIYFTTPDAFIFANVAPVVPDGVTYGHAIQDSGLSLRWIRDYDPTVTTDRSVISTFTGTGSLNDGVVPVGYTAPTGSASARATAGSDPHVAGGAYNARAVKMVIKTS